jgi:hypothetical protein
VELRRERAGDQQEWDVVLFLGETKKKMNLVHHDKSPLLCDQQELLWHINYLLLAPTEEQGSQQGKVGRVEVGQSFQVHFQPWAQKGYIC